jgi:diguanylate cyclase (GGDEF)-like protein
MDAAYGVVAKHMPELLPGAAGVLYVVAKSNARSTLAARWGAPKAVADAFAPQDCQCIRGGQPHFVVDAAREPNCGHFTGAPPACYVCVPLSAHGEVIGILHVHPVPDAGHTSPWSDARRNLIKAAAQHVALALANLELRARLFERATHDKLTGLYNRHYILERFEQELNRARRHGRPIGVVMLDIDHFKRFNDNFGHAAGDLVLRELAGVMQRVTRSSDAACRYGGEEFLLLMPETTREGTLASAEKLRQEAACLALAYEGRELGRITISAGVAVYPEHGANADALLRAADEALYEAKGAGRNRVFVHSVK